MTDSTSSTKLTLDEISKGVSFKTGRSNRAKVSKKAVKVTAEIKAEYDAIPLNLELEKLQPASATPVPQKPIKLELGFNQKPKTPPVKAKLSISGPGAVTLFRDEAMKLPFTPGPIPASDFAGGKKLELFMLGKTAGKLELTLETQPTAGATISGTTSAKLALGVFALRLRVHVQDAAALATLKVNPNVAPISNYHTALKNLKLPAQKALSNKSKIHFGRVVHEQAGASHGRARLLIKKIDPSHLPAGVDDYFAVIDTTHLSGALAIFDVEFDGAAKTLPLKIPFSKLTTADQELFVEGTTKTKKLRDARVDVGIDRPARGLAHTPKRHVDWGAFSVVKINKVDVLHTPAPGKPTAWDPAKQRFTINFDSDNKGRKLELTADLGAGVRGVKVHFALIPHADNQKAANWGVNLPSTWPFETISQTLKHEDRKAVDDFLHFSAVTDASGKAKVEVTLSRFGGDKFLPAVYIAQDAHLAKFIHRHADLSKRKPVFAAFEIAVHREFFYQLSKPTGHPAPQPTLAEAAYTDVKASMTLAGTVNYTPATAPPSTFYPEFQMVGGNSATPKAVVGDHNKATLASSLFVANTRQPVKAHAVICDFQYDTDTPANGSRTLTAPPAGGTVQVVMNKPVFDPPLQGGALVVSATFQVGSGPRVTIPAANVSIVAPRANDREVTVTLPATAPAPSAAKPIRVRLRCQGADGPFLGESFGNGQVLVVFDPTQVPDYNDTIAHEFGHAFGQAHGISHPSSTAVPPPPTIPLHPNSTNTGAGCHCGNTACLMFASGPQAAATHKWDQDCHPYLLVEDLSKIS